MVPIRPFSAGELEQICRALGDAMTGSQLRELLSDARIEDRSGESTKWRRLRDNLAARQRCDGHAAAVAHFITLAFAPVRFSSDPEAYEGRREALNRPLAHAGLALREDGKLAQVPAAKTLTEAHRRASGLREKLRERGVHPDVLAACRAELLAENYFHAVLEAIKSLAEKIRNRTGLTSDGAALADAAFGLRKGRMPPLAFNRIETETERSEHTGLHTLIKGVIGAFRNPTAHAPKTSWQVDELDALDLLQTVSLLHRRLDAAHLTPAAPSWGTTP